MSDQICSRHHSKMFRAIHHGIKFLIAASVVATCCCQMQAAVETDKSEKILKHLRQTETTRYLQSDGNRLRPVTPSKATPGLVMYQKVSRGYPILGSYVEIQIGESGNVVDVADDTTTQELQFADAVAKVDGNTVTAMVEQQYLGSLTAVESDAELVWFRIDQTAKLAWLVTTELEPQAGKASPTRLRTILDAATGDLLSQSQLDTTVYDEAKLNEIGFVPRVVINDADGPATARALGQQAAYRPVVAIRQFGFVTCTGVLVAPNVVLTARHCGVQPGDQILFGINSLNPAFVRNVQSVSLPAGPGNDNGGDVAIVRLQGNVPAGIATPMRLSGETTGLVGRLCGVVGYGLNGVGSVGHNFTRDGLRWAGLNMIDAYGAEPSTGLGSNLLTTDFDNGSAAANTIPGSSSVPVDFEATTASGDSGGPLVLDINGEPVLAGILSAGTTVTSQYGDISMWAATAVFRNQIEAAGGTFVAEPTIMEMEYALLNPVSGSPVPKVELPGGGQGYRIYNQSQYSLNLIATQVSPNASTRVTEAGLADNPFAPDLALGDLYPIQYQGGWQGLAFTAAAVGPEFYLSENDELVVFDVPVFRNGAGLSASQFGSTSATGQAFFLGSLQPQQIPAELIEVQLSSYAATDSWQNRDYPEDVNDDGFISPSDAIRVINHLNFHPEIVTVPFEQPGAGFLIDVNGDSSISPADALTVINELNRLSGN